MRTAIFIAIVLVSGCFAGVIHGTVNLAIVEPYLDTAIGIENQNSGVSSSSPDAKRFWFSIPIAVSRYGSTIARLTVP